ncbi:hypothetical protein ACQP1S_03515 [Micromonospora matsumotoense]|uniref:hypothetical protein n=1 Tax=Micromonospora matsumotoense TaxID=121616 RepID=UPI003D901A9A
MACFRLLTGRGLALDLVCRECGEAGGSAALVVVCEGCVDRLIEDGELLAR